MRFILLHADSADLFFAQTTDTAQHGQQPARFSPFGPAYGQGNPLARPKRRALGAFRPLGPLAPFRTVFAVGTLGTRGAGGCGLAQILWRGQARVEQAQTGDGQRFRAVQRRQARGKGRFFFGRRIGPSGIGQQAFFIAAADIISGRCSHPFGSDLAKFQQPFGLVHLARRYDQHRHALAPSAPCPARAVQQRFGIHRQIGMDHQIKARQVNTPRGDIGCDTDLRATVAHGLQRMGAFRLRQLARQTHDRETPIAQTRHKAVHSGAGVGENDRVAVLMIAQQVQNGGFHVNLGHLHSLIGNVGVLARACHGVNAHRITLVMLGQGGNHRWHSGRKQQRAPFFGRFGEHEFQIFAKAHIEHFVRFIQHHSADLRQVQATARDVVAQAARRAHDNMRAPFQRAAFVAHVHPAHTRRHLHACFGIQPREFALDLQGQFARGGHNQRQGRAGGVECVGIAQQSASNRQTKPHRFPRSGLRRDQQVFVGQFGVRDRLLHGGQGFIAFFRKGFGQRGDHGQPWVREQSSALQAGGRFV